MSNSINEQAIVIKELLNDDGKFPNSGLYLLMYKKAFIIDENTGADYIEKTFRQNNWTNSWRAGIFDYAHYHTNTHEVLGVFKGTATVQFGGENGIIKIINIGDVVIIPAGVAHKCLQSDDDFNCVGAYPGGINYDIKKGEPGDRPKADKNIQKVPLPENDPVYKEGPLQLNWEIQ